MCLAGQFGPYHEMSQGHKVRRLVPPRFPTSQPTTPVGRLLAYLWTRPPILFFGFVIWVHEVGRKQFIAENIDEFDDCGWRALYYRSLRSIPPPQLDPLVPILIEYTYFPDISWSSRLPVCVGALELAWWCSDWIGIACSWLVCKANILVMVSSGKNQWGL